MSGSAVKSPRVRSVTSQLRATYEVRSSGASLFGTLLTALVESLVPDAEVRTNASVEGTLLRQADVLLTDLVTGRSLAVFASAPDRETVARHFAEHTYSMISVDASREELTAAIASIQGGPAFVSSSVVQSLASSKDGQPTIRLSNREQEVVRLVAEGHSNLEMAALLYVSPHTVRSHLQSASSKLGVNSRAKLAVRARALGLA